MKITFRSRKSMYTPVWSTYPIKNATWNKADIPLKEDKEIPVLLNSNSDQIHTLYERGLSDINWFKVQWSRTAWLYSGISPLRVQDWTCLSVYIQTYTHYKHNHIRTCLPLISPNTHTHTCTQYALYYLIFTHNSSFTLNLRSKEKQNLVVGGGGSHTEACVLFTWPNSYCAVLISYIHKLQIKKPEWSFV